MFYRGKESANAGSSSLSDTHHLQYAVLEVGADDLKQEPPSNSIYYQNGNKINHLQTMGSGYMESEMSKETVDPNCYHSSLGNMNGRKQHSNQMNNNDQEISTSRSSSKSKMYNCLNASNSGSNIHHGNGLNHHSTSSLNNGATIYHKKPVYSEFLSSKCILYIYYKGDVIFAIDDHFKKSMKLSGYASSSLSLKSLSPTNFSPSSSSSSISSLGKNKSANFSVKSGKH